MATPRVMILRAAGTNCDHETFVAWQQVGAAVEKVHLSRLIERPALLGEYQILTIPGGFSFGDDIAAGRIFAAQLERGLSEAMREFVAAGRLVLGICNGFQILVKAGLLPFSQSERGWRDCTITYNEPPGFQDRWTFVRATSDRCVFLDPGRVYEFPIAHGEGRVEFASATIADRVRERGHIALQYVMPPPDCRPHADAYNPNGSVMDIAALCDETGRVFGLMPHPDRFTLWTQHPCWTSLPARSEGDGLSVFHRGVAYFR